MRIAPSTECEACGKPIGNDDHVICLDGITSKIVAFHKTCHSAGLHPATKDPSLQRHYKATLGPINFASTVKGIG